MKPPASARCKAGLCASPDYTAAASPPGTDDGWSLETVTLDWPACQTLFLEPFASLYDSFHGKPSRFHKIATELELRACGFSYSGCSLVVTTSSDISIYDRR
ncbi:MAG: hypothetical protein FWD68_06350 [Alphaproteobacteria bacterium]|nr:hypothetical protein [Alphaproteobacteria bacterium]